MSFLTVFGAKVRIYRKNKGLNQRELADLLGYKSHASIMRIEQGKQDVPLSVVEKMSKIFGIGPEVFFFSGNDSCAEFLPYLEKVDEGTLAAIRKLLDMPEKKASSSSTVKENA